MLIILLFTVVHWCLPAVVQTHRFTITRDRTNAVSVLRHVVIDTPLSSHVETSTLHDIETKDATVTFHNGEWRDASHVHVTDPMVHGELVLCEFIICKIMVKIFHERLKITM